MSESNGTRYFVKELLSNKVRLPSGRPIHWQETGDDTGVIKTNDQSLIAELEKAARGGFGGIREVDAAGYEDAKKNATAEQLHKLSLFRANNILQRQRPRITDANVAAGVKPAPAKPTTSPTGEPLRTPQTIPLPRPVAKRRSVLVESAKAEEPKAT